jgi:hypothetical protein
VAYSEFKPFENHMNSELRKTVGLVSKYQSLPRRSAEGFSERPMVGCGCSDSGRTPSRRMVLPRPYPGGPRAPRAFVTTATCCLVTGRDNTTRTEERAGRDCNYRGSKMSGLRARVWIVGGGTCSVCCVGEGR